MLTKKHFIAIAEILKESRKIVSQNAMLNLMLSFSDYFEAENKNFSYMTFKKAIGYDDYDFK